MVAESLHSIADSINEILLLVGARRSLRPPDRRHPFGYARFRYVYAYTVSLAVFWIGGVLALIEGLTHIFEPESVVEPLWAFGVLAFAAVFEGWSLRTTIITNRRSKGSRSWRHLLRRTKTPELIVILLEDLGALVGIALAAAGLTLAAITGDGTWDAIASVAIGVLLMGVGLVINRETTSLLVGESATDETVTAITEAIEGTEGIVGLAGLRTIHVGPDDLVVAARVLVESAQTAAAIARSIAEAKARILRVTPSRTVIYLEPRVSDSAPNERTATSPPR